MDIKNCSSPCSYDQFVQVVPQSDLEDFWKKCRSDYSADHFSALLASTAFTVNSEVLNIDHYQDTSDFLRKIKF